MPPQSPAKPAHGRGGGLSDVDLPTGHVTAAPKRARVPPGSLPKTLQKHGGGKQACKTTELILRKGGQGSSRFKGISWHKAVSKWSTCFGKTYLGLFVEEEDASRAYSEEARRLGVHADHLNEQKADSSAKLTAPKRHRAATTARRPVTAATMTARLPRAKPGPAATVSGAALATRATPAVHAAAAAPVIVVQSPATAAQRGNDLEDASTLARIEALKANIAVQEARAAVQTAIAAQAAKQLERYSHRN